MEKLISLLNEYVDEKGMSLRWRQLDGQLLVGDGYGENICESILISKNYGFINRLVQNDLVDLKKLPIRLECYYQNKEVPELILDDEYILLMELSITAFPIDLLINLLID